MDGWYGGVKTVYMSFVQEERDFVEPALHACRYGYFRPVTLWSPVVVAGFIFIGSWALSGWSSEGARFLAIFALLLGVVIFLSNWYLAPRWNSALLLQMRELNSQSFGQCEVRVSPEGVGWSTADAPETVQPWGVVRSVDTLPGGISIRLGRPSVILWIPLRAFPSGEELREVGVLAHEYFSQTRRLPTDEVQWPLTYKQRRARIVGGAIWIWPFILVLAIAWMQQR